MDIKTNRGVIFKNTKKQSEKHPDYRGTINVEGTEKDIALYVNESASGNKYFSVVISEPYKKDEPKSGDVPF